MLRLKAVLPIPGRAATIIKSDGCRPAVLLSKSLNPVGTPVIMVFRSNSFSTILMESFIMSPPFTKEPLMRCSESRRHDEGLHHVSDFHKGALDALLCDIEDGFFGGV